MSDLNRLLETAKTTKQTLSLSSDSRFRGGVQKSRDAGGRSHASKAPAASGEEREDRPPYLHIPENFLGAGTREKVGGWL